MINLSGNSVSTVTQDGIYIFKKQPKYLADNEWYALETLRPTGLVPIAWRIDDETIQMECLVSNPVYDPDKFLKNCDWALGVILNKGLRHGDITTPHVFVASDMPIIIDWGESRIIGDPRPDKRREGDEYWLIKTANQLIDVQHKG